MKKVLFVIAGLLLVSVLIIVLKRRQVLSRLPDNKPAESSEPNSHVRAIDAYVEKNPTDPATPHLQRLSAALKARPAHQDTVLGEAAEQSIQDGSVSDKETVMLREAAELAEREQIEEHELQAFTAKHLHPASSAETAPAPIAAAPIAKVTPATQAIDAYVKKNPSGKGVPQLRRISKAAKTRPGESKAMTEAAVRSIADGSVSKEEAKMLDEAAVLVEDQGLSPQEMAEFSKKYSQVLTQKQKTTITTTPPESMPAPLPSFDGKRQLNYSFTGVAQCEQTLCKDIQLSIRVTSGQWVETRQQTVDSQGRYALEMPVLSVLNEKVRWRIEAYSKDLRKAILVGERVTAGGDKDLEVENNLVLK